MTMPPIRPRPWPWLPCALAATLGIGIGIGAMQRPFEVALAALTLTMTLPVGARLLTRRPMHPLEPIGPFLLCYGITFVLKPTLDSAGFTTYTDWFRFDEISATRAIAVAGGSLLVILGAYFSGGYRAFLRVLPRVDQDPSLARARITAILLAAGGVLSLMWMMHVARASFSLAAAASGAYRTGMLEATYGRGHLTVLCTLATFAPGILLFVALVRRKAADWGLFVLVAAAVTFVLTVLYSRQLFLQTAVILLVIMHFRTRWPGPRTIVAIGIAILILGGFLGLRLREDRPNVLQSLAFLGHTFDSFEFLSAALDRLPATGMLGGLSFAEDLSLTFLPRSVFPEKPDVFGVVRVQNLVAPAFEGYEVTKATFPPGFHVEAYANFGVVGLLLMSIAYGVGLRLAFAWFWPRRSRLFALLVFGGLILNMTGMFRSAAQFLLQMVVYSALLYLALYGRIPVRPDPPTPATASS